MSFCPKCGKLLKVFHSRTPALKCGKCGYKTTNLNLNRIIQYVHKPIHRNSEEIAALDKNELGGLRTYPIVHNVCHSCGKTESETWTVAVGSEGNTSMTFFRCVACGHTEREAE
jgi:DNA-directed RNA polymerase subunit M/transcription elongation factor TFIIS